MAANCALPMSDIEDDCHDTEAWETEGTLRGFMQLVETGLVVAPTPDDGPLLVMHRYEVYLKYQRVGTLLGPLSTPPDAILKVTVRIPDVYVTPVEVHWRRLPPLSAELEARINSNKECLTGSDCDT